jgi:NADPH2:quinone reductase
MAVSCFYLGYGSFAAECLAGGDFALDAPDSMSAAEAAAFLIPFHTAYVALVRRAALQRGETLLVLGAAGGTGSAALQLGKVLGARVIAVAAGAEKTSFCAGLGADIVIDRRTTDIAAAVREATGGRGADCVYDPVSGDAFHAATRCIAPEGRLLLIGFASGKWATPELWPIVSGNFSVVGVFPGGYSREFRENAQTFLLDRWYKGDLRVPIYRTLPFECAREAVALLARGEVMGKVVVDGAL